MSLTVAQHALALCRIDSVTGHEERIAEHIARWAAALYPPGEVFRASHSFLLGKLADARPTVALVGHLDTVAAPASTRAAVIEGDRLVGLGSSDMKGGVAVMMALAESLPRQELPVNLLLILYEREEGPFAESGLAKLLVVRPELAKVAFAIALEPTDNTVQVGCMGSIHAALRFEGASAHSARPWEGINAIHRAGSLLAELDERGRSEVVVQGFSFHEVFSATMAQGGRARNVVPDGFELNVNYRFAPGKSLARAKEDVLRLVGGRAKVDFTDLAPAGAVETESDFFRRLVDLSGQSAQPKQAWTDVARFSLLGVPAVNFGPGEPAQAHQANESASLRALEVCCATLSAFSSAAP